MASFRNCFSPAFGTLGNSRFPRLCVERPKGKGERLLEGWDLFRTPPNLCLLMRCPQAPNHSPALPTPPGICSSSTGSSEERCWQDGVTKAAGRKTSEAAERQRLKLHLPLSPRPLSKRNGAGDLGQPHRPYTRIGAGTRQRGANRCAYNLHPGRTGY